MTAFKHGTLHLMEWEGGTIQVLVRPTLLKGKHNRKRNDFSAILIFLIFVCIV